MGILKDLYNPTIDGVVYTGLFNAVMQKYNYTPSYFTAIVASLVDGYTYNAHGDALLRPVFEACKTTPAVMKSAYDALYYVLATHESDLKRYNDLAETNLKGLVITETIRNEYGQDVTQKSYGADILQKAFGQDATTHSYGEDETTTNYGAVVVSVENAPRQNTTVESKAPYDTNTFADRAKSETNTEEFTDETTTGTHADTETRAPHIDTDTRSARNDTETRSARTDTDTRNSHTDNTSRSTILSMSARDFYEIEKMLIGCNFYEEIASSILSAVCMSIY